MRRRALGLLSLVTIGCAAERSVGVSPVPGVNPGLRFVAGGAVDDTVLAQPSQLLVAEVGGANGRPVAGAYVRIEARTPADPTRRNERGVYLCLPAAIACGMPSYIGDEAQVLGLTTDSLGRVSVQARLGTVAGPARVVVTVPALGLRDSATFTVRPGAATSVRFGTRDTIVAVNALASLRPSAYDRFGNARPDALALTTSDTSVAGVDAVGVVMGRNVGRARVVARSAAGVDSALVTVVPAGRLVGWDGMSVVVVDMDGSHLRRVASATSTLGVYPRWSEDGALIAFQTGAPVAQVIDSSGGPAHTVGAGGDWSQCPAFVAGRDVMYVIYGPAARPAAPDTARYISAGVWREPARGGAARQVASLRPVVLDGGDHPDHGGVDFSPDGEHAVLLDAMDGFVVLDLTSGAQRTLGEGGFAPRWSPDGQWIAYLTPSADIGLVRADGTGQRIFRVGPLSRGFAWSPNGRYLLARSAEPGGVLRLTRLSDGAVLSFTLGVDLFQPSWR